MPSFFSIGFQDFRSLTIGSLHSLHNHIIVVILRVLVFISYVLSNILLKSYYYKFFSEWSLIETIWSIVPVFILIILVFPSIRVLYQAEETINTPRYSIKIVAHQWYWTYISPYIGGLFYSSPLGSSSFSEYDSIIESSDSYPRLLGITNFLYLPFYTPVRFLITSRDVIHSFAVPSLGLKVDALPGRINQLFTTPSRFGVFFGQCSEICGSNHSFIPIGLKVCSSSDYTDIHDSFYLENF